MSPSLITSILLEKNTEYLSSLLKSCGGKDLYVYVVVVQLPSCVQFFTISWSLPGFISIESVMPSSHLTYVALFSCPESSPASGSFVMS